MRSQKEIERLTTMAEAGDAEAQVNLGLAYEKGETPSGVDYDLCYKYYKMAADQGYALGENNVGFCYEKGYGVKQDFIKAVQWYEKAADKGNGLAAANAAHMYMAELGVAFDQIKVVKYTKMGAADGITQCMYNLGAFYLHGKYVERDVEKAQYYIELAAEKGHQLALNMLSHCDGDVSNLKNVENISLQDAISLFQNGEIESAFEITHAKVDQGDSDAMALFGEFMFRLTDGQRFTVLEFEGYKSLAIVGDETAEGINDKFKLIVKLPNNIWFDNPADFPVYFYKAAELGNASAINYVNIDNKFFEDKYAEVIKSNDGVRIYELGKELINRNLDSKEIRMIIYDCMLNSANLGYIPALGEVGMCYEVGFHVDKDITKAIEWYKKGADLDDTQSLYCLADCFFNGNGIGQDLHKALALFQKSADQGNPDAQFQIGVCYYNGIGVDVNHLQAVEWYKKAAAQNHPGALNNLGVYYSDGKYHKPYFNTATNYFLKAIKYGSKDAPDNLERLEYQKEKQESDSGNGCMIPLLLAVGSLVFAACSLI